MKNKVLFSSLVLTTMTAGAIMPAVEAAPIDSKPSSNKAWKRSKVTGAAKSGGVTLIVEDSDMGELKIGREIPNKKETDLVTVNDFTGLNKPWQLTVKSTNYDKVKDEVKFGVNIADSGETLITNSESKAFIVPNQYGEQKFDGEYSGTWGAKPTVSKVTNELTWTLTPDMTLYWGTAPITISTDGKSATVGAGTISKEGYGELEDIMENLEILSFDKGVIFPDREWGYMQFFAPFYSIKEINGLENVDVSQITNMDHMFEGFGVQGPLDIDLSTWDTSNVTSFRNTFSRSKIKDISSIANWDVSNATYLDGMFNSSFIGVYPSFANWDVSNVESITGIFQSAFNPESEEVGMTPVDLDLSNWTLPKVTNVNNAISENRGLRSVKLNGWDFRDIHPVSFVNNNQGLEVIEGDAKTTMRVQFQSFMGGTTGLKRIDLPNLNMDGVSIHNQPQLEYVDISGTKGDLYPAEDGSEEQIFLNPISIDNAGEYGEGQSPLHTIITSKEHIAILVSNGVWKSESSDKLFMDSPDEDISNDVFSWDEFDAAKDGGILVKVADSLEEYVANK